MADAHSRASDGTEVRRAPWRLAASRAGRGRLAACAAVLGLSLAVAGCSSGGSGGGGGWAGYGTARGECSQNRGACGFEGRYEPDEEAYAEQEARRLNRAALDRIRRSW